jgi:hypothetical protein
MNNDTQPLTPAPEAEEQVQKAWKWDDLASHPLMQAFRQANEEGARHIHGPFTFLMNQNHNALRGCTSCGQTWAGVMAGTEDSIRWHSVHEPDEEEE